MRTLGWAWLLSGCGPLTIEVVQEPCVDVDLTDPGPPDLLEFEEGADRLVLFSAVFAPSDAIFDPVIDVPRRVLGPQDILVTEGWTEGSGAALCWFPGMLVYEPPGGRYNVEWYQGGDPVPVVRETFEW